MTEILAMVSILAPITAAVVMAFKKAGFYKRALPFLAMAIGVIIGLVSGPLIDAELGERLWAGFISGLTAVGLFETGKQAADNGNHKEG